MIPIQKMRTRKKSDINFLIEFEPEKKIDIMTPESISPYIKPHIDKEIIYERL